jgi:endonuclease/exonuclease/phosphatase family metal-dependent hydrolase
MPCLATFNANNFFLRYKFVNTYPGDRSKKSAVDAATAVSTGYVPGRAFGRYGKGSYVVWDPARRDLAAQLLREPDGRLPDILCLQEVENMPAIRVLNDRHFGSYYRYLLLIDSYDERNIDVAVLSRYPLGDVRTHVDDPGTGERLFSRDCLEVTVQVPGTPLTLFVNHLKSKYSESTKDLKAGHKLRQRQAEAVARIVRSRFKGSDRSTALYAVIGDVNDTPESPWTRALDGMPELVDVIARHRPADDRWTYYWRAKGRVSQIDRILASKALARRIDAVARARPARKPYIGHSGLAYRELNAQGEILPEEVTVTYFEPDAATPTPATFTAAGKVPFRFPRFEPILDDISNNTSDHCPVKVWF